MCHIWIITENDCVNKKYFFIECDYSKTQVITLYEVLQLTGPINEMNEEWCSFKENNKICYFNFDVCFVDGIAIGFAMLE